MKEFTLFAPALPTVAFVGRSAGALAAALATANGIMLNPAELAEFLLQEKNTLQDRPPLGVKPLVASNRPLAYTSSAFAIATVAPREATKS